MPVSDAIAAMFGAASYIFVLGFVFWTGYRTRKEARVKNNAGAIEEPPSTSASKGKKQR